MTARRVILGLGGNEGDRLAALRRGIRFLAVDPALRVEAISPVYESDALLPAGASPDWDRPYLNLTVALRSDLDPEVLLGTVKRIERAAGRREGPRWSPRVLDIDLLAIEGIATDGPTLSLPHRDLLDRPFALLPFADLAPDWPLSDGTGGGRTAGERAAAWRIEPDLVPFRTRRIPVAFSELVGIVNLTPDSFSDGGRWLDPEVAIAHAIGMAEAGAAVIDLGAESTRPGAAAVDADTEWTRLSPVLEALRRRWAPGTGPKLSVDTRHGGTAARAVDAGADWINDVTGFTDLAMVTAAARSTADLVVMHSRTIPPRADHTLDPDRDPIHQLLTWGRRRIDVLADAGIGPERIIFDPGIGFGKTPWQTAEVLRRVDELRALPVRLLVGHSRKSFLTRWFPGLGPDRDPETAALAQSLAEVGVDYLRVHDVALTARVLGAGAMIAPPVRWQRLGL